MNSTPAVTATTKTPDFKVKQPDGSEFLLEACTSAKVSSGPEKNPRAGRIRDFLGNLDLGGYWLAMEKLKVGPQDLAQPSLEGHIRSAISNSKDTMRDGKISIPPYEIDGWRVKLTAYPTEQDRTGRSTLRQEPWGRTWTGPSYPLLEPVEKKSKRYGNQLDMPYVIAVNSGDHEMESNIKETLFGANQEARAKHDGFWGSASTASSHVFC